MEIQITNLSDIKSITIRTNIAAYPDRTDIIIEKKSDEDKDAQRVRGI